MNVFGQRERTWRKARTQGVSPIIATILLVAITVVLAAVLYVLISGLTSGGANTVPIGTTFAFGTAQQTSSPPSATVCGVAAPEAGSCYAVSVQSAGSSATTANMNFGVLKSGTGQAFGTVSIWLPGATTAAATYTYSTTGSAWTGASLPLSLSSVDTIIVYTGGTTTSWAGLGYSLEAIGVGGLSGTVTTALP